MDSGEKRTACKNLKHFTALGFLLLGIIVKFLRERKMWETVSLENLDLAQLKTCAVSRGSLALVRKTHHATKGHKWPAESQPKAFSGEMQLMPAWSQDS